MKEKNRLGKDRTSELMYPILCWQGMFIKERECTSIVLILLTPWLHMGPALAILPPCFLCTFSCSLISCGINLRLQENAAYAVV